jgi:hypothetical protein
VWTVDAIAGEAIVVRMGETVNGATLQPWLRIFSPAGVVLDQSFSTVGAEVAVSAPATGTYLVVAADASTAFAGSGSYRLTLAKTGSAVTVSAGDEGGPMTNGAVYTGTLDVGDLDVYTVTANAGDAITLRMAEDTPGVSVQPWLRIYTPAGVLADSSFSTIGAEVTITAPMGGTYLVVAGDGSTAFAGSGAYRLTLAKSGTPVTVPPGDTGGPLVNGLMHTGTIDVGDIDLWTVDAVAGDAIVVRMGETTPGSTLQPWLRIFSPAGALLDNSFSTVGAEVAVTAPVSGQYIVVAADGSTGFGGSGGYRLTLGKTGDPVTVSPGDEGGLLSNGAHSGVIDVGDLDVWYILANVGDNLSITMTETVGGSSLQPWLRLYAPNGTLVGNSFAAATATINHTTTTSGTYLLLGGDAGTTFAGSGGYNLNGAGATGSAVPTLNVDASTLTKYDALTDGLLVLRYLFGLTGPSLTQNAVGVTATRTTPTAIADYLDSIRLPTLDIDGNGEADALTDGLLIIRYLFGLRGSTLIVNAVDPLGTRTNVTDIENYIQSLMP